jgi:hypothetical protein
MRGTYRRRADQQTTVCPSASVLHNCVPVTCGASAPSQLGASTEPQLSIVAPLLPSNARGAAVMEASISAGAASAA